MSSSKDAFLLFDQFIYAYPSMLLVGKSDDTAYFENIKDVKDKLYYHFKLVDPEKEFSYNYTSEEVIRIKNIYNGAPAFMFDLSYRSESSLLALFKAFKMYLRLNRPELVSDILVSHPVVGLQSLEKEY